MAELTEAQLAKSLAIDKAEDRLESCLEEAIRLAPLDPASTSERHWNAWFAARTGLEEAIKAVARARAEIDRILRAREAP